jgi:excisionase family DNA binding protein
MSEHNTAIPIPTRLVRARQVAERFGFANEGTVYRMARQGQLPVVKIGRSYYFSTSELEKWIAGGGQVSLSA